VNRGEPLQLAAARSSPADAFDPAAATSQLSAAAQCADVAVGSLKRSLKPVAAGTLMAAEAMPRSCAVEAAPRSSAAILRGCSREAPGLLLPL
jgi:hypothetical protein